MVLGTPGSSNQGIFFFFSRVVFLYSLYFCFREHSRKISWEGCLGIDPKYELAFIKVFKVGEGIKLENNVQKFLC